MYIYTLLVLFFVSLISIIIMMGRKLVLLRKGTVLEQEEKEFQIAHLDKLKNFTIVNIRKWGHNGLVTTLRFYIKSTNILKNKYQETKIKVRKMATARHANGEKKEISKFLKIIGEYKNKIREIKHRIKKEENL